MADPTSGNTPPDPQNPGTDPATSLNQYEDFVKKTMAWEILKNEQTLFTQTHVAVINNQTGIPGKLESVH